MPYDAQIDRLPPFALFDLKGPGDALTAYAKDVVMSDFERPGDDDVLEKVQADLTAAGVEMDAARLRQKMDGLLGDAKSQVMAE